MRASDHAPGAALLAVLRVFCLVLIAVHLAVPGLWTEEAAWGMWPVTYLPPLWRWGLAALAAATCVPPLAGRIVTWGSSFLDRLLRPLSDWPLRTRHLACAGVALLSLVPFYLFHIVHTRWGDSYILVNGLAYPDPALRITGSWQAPLTIMLHAWLWQLGHRVFAWPDAWPAYRLLSPLAGALYVYILLRLADSIGRNRTEKLVIVGLMATLGTMQLFFGYAENYTLAAVGILLFLWLGLETMQGHRPLWQPALALAITNGLHPSTIILDPTLLYVGWRWARPSTSAHQPSPPRSAWAVMGQIALPVVAVAAVVFLLMSASGHGIATLFTTDRPGGGDARWFVPLAEVSTRWERYTMFSWAHLRDWLNEQLLTAPVTLGGLVIGGVALLLGRPMTKRGDGASIPAGSGTANAELAFLGLATALYWLFTWVWNPDYGGQRDWDLFSLAALPATLLLARLLPRVLPERGQLAQAGLMLTATSAFHTVAWIYQNTLPWDWT